ncbi:hypothetical protein EGI26_01675 [Lacihabitans sp. CCS-44]|nr:hypothetical protein [Lacihabitans sp. CCS-44]
MGLNMNALEAFGGKMDDTKLSLKGLNVSNPRRIRGIMIDRIKFKPERLECVFSIKIQQNHFYKIFLYKKHFYAKLHFSN